MTQGQHRTRSGKVFRYEACQQISFWAVVSELLQTVLPAYLDFESLLHGRRVCQAWRTCFSPFIHQLQLQQPTSARSAAKLGRKSAAAFSNAATLRLFLHDAKEFAIDLTVEGTAPNVYGAETLGHPAAAAALLRQLQKGGKVQHLQLWKMPEQACSCLPAVLKAAPQLRVLDLSCCPHPPADVHVLAQHTPLLQELLLHCQVSTTLSDKRIKLWKPSMREFGWEDCVPEFVHWNSYDLDAEEQEQCKRWAAARHEVTRRTHGGRTCYGHADIAALAKLPNLQLLECPVPNTYSDTQFTPWFNALAALTTLTGLQLVGQRYSARPPASAVQALSSLKALQRLRCDAGAALPRRFGEQLGSCERSAQQDCWGTVLPSLTSLTRLELLHVLVDDAMLCAIGSNCPQLKHLLLDRNVWEGQCSKEGADAVAHVSHIELLCDKGLECSLNLPLLKLPGVTKVIWRHYMAFERQTTNVDGGWTQETCACWSCCRRQHQNS